MRQSSVRRLQQPGGVRDRVKDWQRKNALLMGDGNPEVAPSEPTEVAFKTDEKSVTETDRMRIKGRKKPKPNRPPAGKKVPQADDDDDWDDDDSESDNGDSPAKDGPAKDGPAKSSPAKSSPAKDSPAKGGLARNNSIRNASSRDGPLRVPKGRKTSRTYAKVANPPKRRIVSDDNWMKRKNKNRASPKFAAGKQKPELSQPTPIPKNFLQRTAQNPTVKSKIRDWASRVEIPDTPPPTRYTRDIKRRVSKSKADRRPSPSRHANPISYRSAPKMASGCAHSAQQDPPRTEKYRSSARRNTRHSARRMPTMMAFAYDL